jgi:TolA-binding protein
MTWLLAALTLAVPSAGRAQDAKSPEALIAQATARQKDRDYAAAAELWRAVVAEFPADARASASRHNLALCLLESGKPADSANECAMLLTATPAYTNADDVRLLRGTALAEAGRTTADAAAVAKYAAEARAALEALVKPGPKAETRAAALYQLGVLLTATDAAAAGAAFDTFLTDFAAHEQAMEVRLRRAGLHATAKEPAKAEPLLRAAADAKGFAHADLACAKLAECLYAQGKRDDAIKLLTDLPARFPASKYAAAATARVATWMADAAGAALAKDPRAAEAAATAAIDKTPNGPNAGSLLLLRATARLANGAVKEALDDLTAARRLKLSADEDVEAGRLTGVCLGRLGKHAEAVTTLDEVLKRHPNAGRTDAVLFEQAVAIEAAGQGGAAAAFERAAKHAPDGPLAAAAWARAGERHLAQKTLPEASRCFVSAIRKASDDATRDFARSRLGWCQLQENKPADAAATFDRLATDAPAGELAAAAI